MSRHEVGLAIISLFMAGLSPVLVIRLGNQYPTEIVVYAKRHLVASAVVGAVLISDIFGISLSDHSANKIIVVLSILMAGFLVMFSFNLKPKWLGWTAGCLSTLIGAAAFLVLVDLTSGEVVAIGKDLYCRETAYGFVTSDSGTVFEVFNRYKFIDEKVMSYRESVIYPEDNVQLPPGQVETLRLCQSVIDANSHPSH